MPTHPLAPAVHCNAGPHAHTSAQAVKREMKCHKSSPVLHLKVTQRTARRTSLLKAQLRAVDTSEFEILARACKPPNLEQVATATFACTEIWCSIGQRIRSERKLVFCWSSKR